MAKVTFKGTVVDTRGTLPAEAEKAPDFTLVGQDLSVVRLEQYLGKRLILNIFPSLDTSVCAASVRRFNEEAAQLRDTEILCISLDLPFAQARFCGAEGIERVKTASAFRDKTFGEDYGVLLEDGPLAGLFARAIVVLDESNVVLYTELVPEITQEPDYAAALAKLA